MRKFFSFCFDQLTDPFSLPLDPIMEYILLGFIGILAFALAYRLVGNMYDADIIGGRVLGSLFHWILRFVLFVFMWGIVNSAIAACRFVAEHWIILLAILGSAVFLVGAFLLTRHIVIQNRLQLAKETNRKP